jgi:lipoprotein-anchoring transpeptidase ErfK/SrfK
MVSTIRSVLAKSMIALLAVTLVTPILPSASVQDASAASLAEQLGLDPAYIPPDMGQSSLDVFVPETGHSVRGYMLDYWRANGASGSYGNPISEPFGASNGLYSQAFERGIFQFSPEWMWTDDPAVRLMPIGQQEVTEDRLETRSDGRRTGSDRRASAWRPGSEDVSRFNDVANEGGRFSNTTGFSISGAYAAWYDTHEGWFYMGAPISEPHVFRGAQVQYFENGLLMIGEDGVARPAPLPKENPEKYGFDTTPIEQGDRPVFSESLFYTTWNPAGVDPTVLPGRKRIDISISEQTMRVYQGDTLVLQSYISTGLSPNDTEVGNFHIRIKYVSQTMSGFTTASGEVVGLGDESGVEGQQTAYTYEVEDVPHVMYFNYQAEALHGAYWHNNFGQRMSHGCVNQPLDVAAFMYDFAPLGTPVNVYA